MRMRISCGIALLVACVLSGCAQSYSFRVDALAAPQTQTAGTAQDYTLENGFPDDPGSSLRFREAAEYVDRALRARGYEPAPEASEANLLVTVSASISEPLNETERTLEPIYYRTWGRSHVIRTPVVDDEGNVRHVATRVYTPPQTRFAGYSGANRSVVVYEKQLELTARTRDGEEIWTVTVESVDRSSDLRAYLPYLVAAATPYLGEETEGAVVVRLNEDDETVGYLRSME